MNQIKHKISEGKPFPIGATLTDKGVNFAIYSQYCEEVFLLLFDSDNEDPTDIIKIENRRKHIWHVFVHSIKVGQLYGFVVNGEYNPSKGMRFNKNKLLLDPYAKAISGKFVNNSDGILYGYDPKSEEKDLSFNNLNNYKYVPKSIVIDTEYDWNGDVAPDIPFEKLLIYEVHLKGFTAHSSSGVQNKGTYLGFIEKIPYLKELGINAIELLPIQEFYVEDFLREKGLTNYWGYNTIGFFAPESSYGTKTFPGCQVSEFKELVKQLHKAGIEVILDVVYNHHGDCWELGPTISFRGIDNLTYYCVHGDKEHPYRYYQNYSGCGNSLNVSNPQVIRLIMDSLRYWVQEMHVDGFRFDLASVLGRRQGEFDKTNSFFDTISQDPILNGVKLIAEPWDISTYQAGNFPIDWAEWNGKFRDTMRRFAKGDPDQVREMGWRVTGSADLFANNGRAAYHSINFITCHDGFTLRDLVTYDYKHNEANLENNTDGCDNNFSWNCGKEGETDDENIAYLRKQMVKNHIIHLLFSAGTPMILAGDELFRTQRGNNNSYCQDNEINWINWEDKEKNKDIFSFYEKAIAFSKKYTILQRSKFFNGLDNDGDLIPDITWYGKDLNHLEWNDPNCRTICIRLDGSEEKSEFGEYQIFMILNADFHLHKIQLPKLDEGYKWYRVIDTSLESGEDFLDEGKEFLLDPQDFYFVDPRSTVVILTKT